jgi:hypothetical protein
LNQQDIQKKEDTIDVKLNVTSEGEKVVIAFEREVSWLGLTPEEALRLAENLKVASITVLRSLTK